MKVFFSSFSYSSSSRTPETKSANILSSNFFLVVTWGVMATKFETAHLNRTPVLHLAHGPAAQCQRGFVSARSKTALTGSFPVRLDSTPETTAFTYYAHINL